MKTDEHQRSYELEDNNWWFQGMAGFYRILLKKYLAVKPNFHILDIGCGTGMIMKNVLSSFGKVHGIDASPEAVEFCKDRALSNVYCANAVETGLDSNTFDCITAFMIIEHIDDDVKFIKELERMCKKGGKVLISSSAFSALWSEHDDACEHMRRYSIKEFNSLIKSNSSFKILKLSYYNIVLFFPALLAAFLYSNKSVKKTETESHRRLWSFPASLNKLLTYTITLDALVTSKLNIPFGVNIITVLEKPL